MTLHQPLLLTESDMHTRHANRKPPQSSNLAVHVIIPVLNEAKAIGSVLTRLWTTLNHTPYSFRITVIDDGSDDRTVEICKSMPFAVNVLKNQKNLGKGGSLLRSFRHIEDNEIVVLMDGDGEHHPEDVPLLIQPLIEKKASMVVGSRFKKTNGILGQGSYLKNRKKYGHFRVIGNALFSILILLFHHKFITDSQCGFRAFAPKLVKRFNIQYSRFEVETEFTIMAIQKGLKILEIPINTGISTRSSYMKIVRDSLKIFLTIIDMKLKSGRKYLKTFFRNYYPQKISMRVKRNPSEPLNPFHCKDLDPQTKAIFGSFANPPRVSVVLPCYNEEETIKQVIEAIQCVEMPNYEIIIVDDGSKDRSVQLVEGLHHVKVFVHEKNQGYGRTLLDGINKATGDLVVTIDSDGQHDPRDIPILCKPILEGRADIVVGSRYAGQYFYRVPLTNRTGEAFIERMMQFIFGQSVKNNQGGLRVFHKRTLDIFGKVKFMDMAFTTELLMIALIKGYKITEGPIHLYDRPVGTSRVKKVRLLMDLMHCFVYYTKIHFLNKWGLISDKNW